MGVKTHFTRCNFFSNISKIANTTANGFANEIANKISPRQSFRRASAPQEGVPMTLYNRGFSYYAVHNLSKAEALRKGDIQENIVDAVDWPVSHNQTQTKKYAPFSVEQLNAIFHAPLYTGCKDDGRNYNKVGKSPAPHLLQSIRS